jgi:hypothetical protein
MAAKSDKYLLEQDWVLEWKRLFKTLSRDNKTKSKTRVSHKPRTKLLVNCPCCSSQVYAPEQQGLHNLQLQLQVAHEAMYVKNNRVSPLVVYSENVFLWVQKPYPWRYWACDTCLTTGRAQLADFETAFVLNSRTYGQIRPYFYFDQTINCRTCRKDFVYTKAQQRWAHETYVIEYEARLNNCYACRKKQNRQLWLEKTTQEAITLARAEPTFENLHKASQMLIKNADPRALYYLRRAKNKAPSFDERAKLELQIKLS